MEGTKLSKDDLLILKKRAEALAARRISGKKDSRALFVCEFLLGNERYGIEALFMQEVFPLKSITHLPGLPGFILGIINVRGNIIPVMDIRKFFGIPERGITELNRVLILKNGKMVTGILADEVLGVRGININDLQPPMATLTGIGENYLRGVTSGRLIVLDAASILDDPAIIVNKESINGGTR